MSDFDLIGTGINAHQVRPPHSPATGTVEMKASPSKWCPLKE